MLKCHGSTPAEIQWMHQLYFGKILQSVLHQLKQNRVNTSHITDLLGVSKLYLYTKNEKVLFQCLRSDASIHSPAMWVSLLTCAATGQSISPNLCISTGCKDRDKFKAPFLLYRLQPASSLAVISRNCCPFTGQKNEFYRQSCKPSGCAMMRLSVVVGKLL
ncbi:unnamed protein product [Protopolystoma xenopodis]|uniref:Uncharacterized protein n=1 Tax=Protopolystoma xenopodis TaxID=117903 RepID=A0A3S5CD78_9PLAT|nr:unnamed protein product [Protopolystoma xenopodis]